MVEWVNIGYLVWEFLTFLQETFVEEYQACVAYQAI
jgi:hypothetical protein